MTRARKSRPAMPNGTASTLRSKGMVSDLNGLAEAKAALRQAEFNLAQTRQRTFEIDALGEKIQARSERLGDLE